MVVGAHVGAEVFEGGVPYFLFAGRGVGAFVPYFLGPFVGGRVDVGAHVGEEGARVGAPYCLFAGRGVGAVDPYFLGPLIGGGVGKSAPYFLGVGAAVGGDVGVGAGAHVGAEVGGAGVPYALGTLSFLTCPFP